MTVGDLKAILALVDDRVTVVVSQDGSRPAFAYGREAELAFTGRGELVGSDVETVRDGPDETGLMRLWPLGHPQCSLDDIEVLVIAARR